MPGKDHIAAKTNLIRLLENNKIGSALISAVAGDRLFTKEEEELIAYLEVKWGQSIYVQILFELSHEIFEEKEAEKIWEGILTHKFDMSCLMNRNVGIAVAAMDYLANVRGTIENPSLISNEGMFTITEVALRDGLTGLYDRFTFLHKLREEVLRCKRHNEFVALLMIDLDHFKDINDELGHLLGDEVLIQTSSTILSCVRETDVAARYGGEEFIIMLPYSNRSQATVIAERVRSQIEIQDGGELKVTASIGISSFPEDAGDPISLIKKADEALYEAKRLGRNQIVALAGSSQPWHKSFKSKVLNGISNFNRKYLRFIRKTPRT